jgi:hypothetical protein
MVIISYFYLITDDTAVIHVSLIIAHYCHLLVVVWLAMVDDGIGGVDKPHMSSSYLIPLMMSMS